MITQSYLPLMYENQLLGLFPIAPTLFTGAETSFVSGAQTLPLKYVRMPEKPNVNVTPDFMAVDVTDTEVRSGSYIQTYKDFVPASNLIDQTQRWVQGGGLAFEKSVRPTSVLYALTGLVTNVPLPMGPSGPPPIVPPPTGTGSVTVRFKLNSPFYNAPVCSFFDLNWVAEFQADISQPTPISVSVGSPTPALIAPMVKAYVLDNPVEIGRSRGLLRNTIRFIKVVPANVPIGMYDYPLTITNSAGSTVVTLTLDVTA